MSLRTIPGENAQAFTTQALAKREVIRTKCQGNEPEDLTQLVRRGLTEATDEGICLEAKQMLREANKPGSITTPEQVLTQLRQLRTSAIDLSVYGPALAKGANSNHQAMYCVLTPTTQIDALAAALQAFLERQPLQQTDRGPITCRRCGGLNHFAHDCKGSGTPSTSSTSSSTTSSTNSFHPNQRGLSGEESCCVNKLISEFQLPSNISDTDYICVRNEKGEVVGECCKKCHRMTKKGPSMHHTMTHNSKNGGSNQTNSTQASGGKGNDEQANATILLAAQAILKSQAESRPPVTPQTLNTALSQLQLHGADHSTPFAGLCHTSSDDDDYHDALAITWAPSKECGGQGF